MSNKQLYWSIVGIVLVLVPTIIMVILSFKHIDMPPMRLLVTYWYWYACILTGAGILTYINRKT